MGNFMEYLELTPSTVNQFFNTITREGQDLIYFDDVVQVIGYLEEAKHQNPRKESSSEGLNLNLVEIELLLHNFEYLRTVASRKRLEEEVDGIVLMFVVDFEKKHGSNSAPAIFTDVDFGSLFSMLQEFPDKLKESLRVKLEKREALGSINKSRF